MEKPQYLIDEEEDREDLRRHTQTLEVDYQNREDAIARVALCALDSTLHEDAAFKATCALRWVGPKNDYNGLRSAATRASNRWTDEILTKALVVVRAARTYGHAEEVNPFK